MTPRSFKRFFTPRSMLNQSGNSGDVKTNRKALEALSSPALNRLGPAFTRTTSKPNSVQGVQSEPVDSLRTPPRKRKLSGSSGGAPPTSPLQSSPLRRVRVKTPTDDDKRLEGAKRGTDIGHEEASLVDDRRSNAEVRVTPIRRSRALQTSGNLCMRSMYGPDANRLTVRSNSGAG